jgi:hypothetical protein
MSDHERLDALRRLSRDRAATPAEKATACHLGKALAARIGERRGSRRKGNDAALPEASRRKNRGAHASHAIDNGGTHHARVGDARDR